MTAPPPMCVAPAQLPVAEESRRHAAVSWKRGAVGVAAGLVGGIGASIVVTQSGRLSLSSFFVVPLVTAIAGGLWAALRTPPLLDKIATAVTLIYIAAVLFGAASPVLAQDACNFSVVSNRDTKVGGSTVPANTPVDVDATSDTEWVIRPHSGDSLHLNVPAQIDGWATITVESVRPVGANVFAGHPTVWQGTLTPDNPPTINVERATWTGVTISGNEIPTGIVPFGSVTLRADVFTNDGERLCGQAIEARIRIIAAPATSWLGQSGVALLLVGAAGVLATGRGAVFRPTTGERINSVPPGGIRAPYLECQFETQADPKSDKWIPVATTAGLVIDRPYRLNVQVTPNETTKDLAEGETPVVATGWSRDFTIQSSINISVLPGSIFNLSIPVVPKKLGRRSLDVNLMAQGHLLQVERIDVDVVESASDPAREQTATTIISESNYSAEDLTRRTPRALQVILRYQASDASVDAQFRGFDGELLATFDTPFPAMTLHETAKGVRETALAAFRGDETRAGMGGRAQLDKEKLDSWLPELATVGQNLHDMFFPKGAAAEENARRVREALARHASSIIQVNQDCAGLGVATLPWTFVYDYPLVVTAQTRVCQTYHDHLDGGCPHREDTDVVCPSGFWGYRYQIEQPPAWVGQSLPRPLPAQISNEDARLVIHFIHNPGADKVSEHQAALAADGAREIVPSTTLSEVRAEWERQGDSLDVIYLYGHHGRQEYTNAGAIFLGEERFTDDALDKWDFSWGRGPLVIINGCNSGAYAGSTHASLLNAFRRAGASGVIGTECDVNTAAAAPFMERVVDLIDNGRPVGEALEQVGVEFLVENNSPLGLVYALFAHTDLGVAVAAPVAAVPVA